jgi:2,3-bisphosphoglycerate-dependent phosphoglycerate mutase
VFRSHNITFSQCYTSVLTRSIVTAQRALEAAGVAYTPIQYDWRLNERHYGALQGLSKERTAERLGRSLVMKWRRSYEARPPAMQPEHPHYDTIMKDPRYRALADDIPTGESLEDCQKRVVMAWNHILSNLSGEESQYSLLVAHANTLRALVMHLDGVEADDIEDLNIPTAIPFFYDIDKATGMVISNGAPVGDNSTSGYLGQFRGTYISDERKKRSFLERRRAANDPWLWALHDHQVARSMLVGEGDNNFENAEEGLVGLEEEAKQNTELFSSALYKE